MEFGIFAQVFVPGFETDADAGAEYRRQHENLDMAVLADEAGYKYLWAPEHHFLEEYSHAPAPEVFLSFAAARTRQIHVGASIYNITPPVNHPARVAERVALIDQLSEGRAEFGTGRGSSSTEFMGFGIPEGDVTRDMYDEVLPQILRMWDETDYSFDGEFFSMPERNVLPKPRQEPHPPIWVAAGNTPTFEKAGSLGIGLHCFVTGPSSGMAPKVKAYKDAVANADPVGQFVNNNVMVVGTMLCMEDREEAFETFTQINNNYYMSLVFKWLDTFAHPPGIPEWPERLPEPTVDQVKAGLEAGIYCVGDPDDCARYVEQYAELGVDQLTFSPLTTTHPFKDAMESMELFGREVIPRFDTDPVHSTTRMREGG